VTNVIIYIRLYILSDYLGNKQVFKERYLNVQLYYDHYILNIIVLSHKKKLHSLNNHALLKLSQLSNDKILRF
jgi:uncharacterized membrane protein